ncbi:MAG: glycosyltransferase family 4 protein, partial [Candidatus Paceibacteria bacterium]
HHSFLGPTGPTLALPILALQSTPIVGTLHDPVPHKTPHTRRIQTKMWTTKMKILSRIPDRIFVHGDGCYQQAKYVGYDMGKIYSIPHGVYDYFKKFDFEKYDSESNTLLFFGSISDYKGFDRIPEILDIVEKEVEDITAIVAGRPNCNQSDVIKSLREDSRVELHAKYIPDDQVGEFFTRASIVVLPYYEASSSGVLMTSYAFNKPVVATDVGDVGQMIAKDNTGLLADPSSTLGIAESIIDILTSDSISHRFTQNVIERKDDYAWENIAKQLIDHYQIMIDK